MKFTFIQKEQQKIVAIVENEKVYSLTAYFKAENKELQSIDQLIVQYAQWQGDIEKALVAELLKDYVVEEPYTYLPVVEKPEKIICVGLNYKKHAEESNMAIPEKPVLFNKFANSLAAHEEDIPAVYDSNENDYEAELAIIIGKEAKSVSKEEALNYVFGYANANDLSARDLQFRTNQWLLGKAIDKYLPLGPYLVTADEVGNPNNLTIQTIYNGKIVQDSNTSDMIFKCDEIISYISHYLTLKPGDIIITGTPEGVLFGLPENERKYMSKGDEMIIQIEKLGQLKNKLV